jgi:DNA modification methylase
MIIEKKKLSELKPAPYNPRQSTAKQEKHLKASLEKFGVVEPIIYNKQTGYIVGGHFRVRELTKLGYKEVECVIVDLNEEDERELNIRLNANTGEWDWDSLANEWDAEKLEDWGLDLPVDLSVTEELEAEEDNYEIPNEINTDIVLGDLFEIGEHRLLCGDSTDSDSVAKLMNGQKADMVFTDPPYGMNLDTNYADIYKNSIANVKNQDRIIGDDKDFNFIDFYALFEYVKEQFWWGADYYQNQLPSNGGIFVWDKVCESMEGRIGNEFELCWSKQRHKKEIIHIKWAGFLGLQKEDGKRQHPTQKPIRLCESFISRFSKESNLLIDPFLGSGSTMVASHQLKRKCYGMELDPKYCQVIIDRMKKLDPSLVIKKNGETM